MSARRPFVTDCRANGPNTTAYLKKRAETEATLKREKIEIKRKELALQAKEQEGRQQQFDMMNKQTTDIQFMQIVMESTCKYFWTLLGHAMFVSELSTVTLWNRLEHSTK